MAVIPEVTAIIQRFDAETTAISDRIDRLIAQIQSGTITDQQEIARQLQPIADRLDALGHDPENPIPLGSRLKG
jgi:hypothetical protein